MLKAILSLIALSAYTFAAKTDLSGCTLTVVPLLTEIVTTTGVAGVQTYGNYAETTFQWDGTEQCQLLDCGGGRAPPRTDVPGCPGYTGTGTVPSLPFPTASLTLIQAVDTGATSQTFTGASGTVTVTPGSVATAASSSTLSSAPFATAASDVSSSNATPSATSTNSSPTTSTATGNGTQVPVLNPTASSSGALGDGAGWNMLVLGLTVVAMAAPHLS